MTARSLAKVTLFHPVLAVLLGGVAAGLAGHGPGRRGVAHPGDDGQAGDRWTGAGPGPVGVATDVVVQLGANTISVPDRPDRLDSL